ncbi:Protein-export membrane protein SecG [Kordia antarctica]|uniref:Protein-export membrane protein SecG n=1 Tax=Kordia antarctica TaxID=1218801 RepID=A0A7L4ZLZ3_9FLAO|nr:preprotein translocase subunit SecG [Kordia antarctica]QHI36964.1 Protein-export membrane protein SecG [Kordia antarctica]
MSSTYYIFIILILIVAFLLMLVIMVQNPKGGGLSSSFGGGGTQQIGGVQKTTDFLDKSTWALATILIGLILVTNFTNLSNSSSQSKVSGDAIEQTTPPVDTNTNTTDEKTTNGQ